MATNLGTKGGFRVGQLVLPGSARLISGSGAPVNGVTGVNLAGPGSIYIDYTGGKIYYNVGSRAVPSWNDIAGIAASEVTLAEGNVLVGNSAGVAAALSAKTTGRILVGDGTTVASVAVSNDATLAANGQLTIAANAITTGKILDGAVTSGKLAAGAGVAALLTAGLGGSHSILKSEAAIHPVVAANAAKARACLVVVTIDETYAGAADAPTIKVGEVDDDNACFDVGVITNQAAGTVLVFAFTNTLNKAIIATSTAAANAGTGGCSVAVLAIPTT